MLRAERQFVRSGLEMTQLIYPNEKWLYTFRKGGYSSYNVTFESVLNGKNIQEVVGEAQSRVTPDHPLVAAADVMGSGWVFLRGNIFNTESLFDKGLDYGVGIALNNSRGALRRFRDRKRGRDLDFVKGDIQLHSTWRRVDKLLAQHNVDGFDVIFSRGIAGTEDLNRLLIASTLKDAYARLTAKNGILLAEVPDFIGYNKLNKFVNLAQDHGIRVQLGRGRIWKILKAEVGVMRIDKLPTSPGKIDFL